MRGILIGAAMVLAAGPALAHPHIFIDATLEVVFAADGRAEGVRITWTYDELISLTFVSERGLDPDFDGVLTEAELATLNGFDMAWHADFPGDTYALLAETPVDMARPEAWSVAYAEGKVTSTHFRRFAAPFDPGAQALVVQVYDPGFYTSYAVTGAIATGREGCLVEVFEPDREAADQILQEALAEYSGSADAEVEFPAVGSAYAEEARVTCGGA